MMDFKLDALSIQQPWAWLIVNGYKSVENRTWATKRRGPFLVHAGKKFDQESYDVLRSHIPEIPLPEKKDFLLGGIVGMATLVACVEPKDANLLTERDAPWHNSGCHGFILEDMKTLPFIPCKGMLGFFKPKMNA